jgi:hypothetical protein
MSARLTRRGLMAATGAAIVARAAFAAAPVTLRMSW